MQLSYLDESNYLFFIKMTAGEKLLQELHHQATNEPMSNQKKTFEKFVARHI